MNVAFILPMPSRKINGGYKVVYEYANYLASNGNGVTILYNADKGNNSKGLPKFAVFLARIYLAKTGPKWFDLDNSIRQKAVYDMTKQDLDSFDAVIATAATTSEYASTAKCKRFYFVQDYEVWSNSEEELIKSYNYPFIIITVSRWLKNKLQKLTDNQIIYIPNGINPDVFKNSTSLADRRDHTICMLYHKLHRKGSDIAIKVLYRLKEKYPDTEAYIFGSPERERDWPEWIHYKQNANETQVAEYMNNSRVFLCTSRQEGFGLTGLESIFCGCALVTTDCLGIREYANTNNSIICEVDDENELYKSVCRLFDDNELCESMIASGEVTKVHFDLNKSQLEFYNALKRK